MHNYENLVVWQRSIGLCREVYRLTEGLPRSEQFGLTSQMRRSVVSIASNIAEGSASTTRKAFLRYLTIAIGSAYELDTQLVVGLEIGLLQPAAADPIRAELLEVRRMIGGLKRSISARS